MSDAWQRLAAKLARNEPIRICFVNDIGFIGGAGIALRRQVQCFLSHGHEVAVICGTDNEADAPHPPLGREFSGGWRGLRRPFDKVEHGHEERAVKDILGAIGTFDPDCIITGNFHWTSWPLALLPALRDSGYPIFTYLHDCHWITGRCAYFQGCERFASPGGCDDSCPTPDEYPSLRPDSIAAAWQARRKVFTGAAKLPLIANSRWTAGVARRGFGGKADVALIHLGLDHRLFSPIDRALARRLLGLPQDRLLILAGAISFSERRKTGPAFHAILSRLRSCEGLSMLSFGHGSDQYPDIVSVGYIKDERTMPLVYSAADVMLSTASEESFGQTLMEAAACGLPIAAFDGGGTADIARDGENAIVVSNGDSDALFDAVVRLAQDGGLRTKLGMAGRALVERHFTLDYQYAAWMTYLRSRVHQSAAGAGTSLSAGAARGGDKAHVPDRRIERSPRAHGDRG